MNDYVVLTGVFYLFGILFKYWPLIAIGTLIAWIVFVIRIGKVRILQVEDMMSEEEEEATS